MIFKILLVCFNIINTKVDKPTMCLTTVEFIQKDIQLLKKLIFSIQSENNCDVRK